MIEWIYGDCPHQALFRFFPFCARWVSCLVFQSLRALFICSTVDARACRLSSSSHCCTIHSDGRDRIPRTRTISREAKISMRRRTRSSRPTANCLKDCWPSKENAPRQRQKNQRLTRRDRSDVLRMSREPLDTHRPNQHRSWLMNLLRRCSRTESSPRQARGSVHRSTMVVSDRNEYRVCVSLLFFRKSATTHREQPCSPEVSRCSLMQSVETRSHDILGVHLRFAELTA